MEYAEAHEKIHWGTWEAKLAEDVNQWKSDKISPIEKQHITNILRIFTQSDVAVGGNYCDIFIPFFGNISSSGLYNLSIPGSSPV